MNTSVTVRGSLFAKPISVRALGDSERFQPRQLVVVINNPKMVGIILVNFWWWCADDSPRYDPECWDIHHEEKTPPPQRSHFYADLRARRQAKPPPPKRQSPKPPQQRAARKREARFRHHLSEVVRFHLARQQLPPSPTRAQLYQLARTFHKRVCVDWLNDQHRKSQSNGGVLFEL